LFIDLFYLPEHLRGAGIGSRIIRPCRGRGASARLYRRLCLHVTFQAPGFYERHGYRRFGEIACPPAGATRIFFSKALS
jgi:hypothetical protein